MGDTGEGETGCDSEMLGVTGVLVVLVEVVDVEGWLWSRWRDLSALLALLGSDSYW